MMNLLILDIGDSVKYVSYKMPIFRCMYVCFHCKIENYMIIFKQIKKIHIHALDYGEHVSVSFGNIPSKRTALKV